MITKRNFSIVGVAAIFLLLGVVVMMVVFGGQAQPITSKPTVVLTPATSTPSPTPTETPEPLEPVKLVFVERLEPGQLSYGRLDNPVPYLFSLEGFPLELLSLSEVKRGAQVPFGVDRTREEPYLLVVYVPSRMRTTTWGISLRLPDGRNATATLEHEEIEPVLEVVHEPTPTPTPMVTPTPTQAPASTPTPISTPVPTPESSPCLPWPETISRILEVLSVPDGLCLMEVPGRLPGALYAYGDLSVRIWFPDWLPPPMPSKEIELRIIVDNGICAAHQHQVVMESGLEFDYQYAWSRTPEGVDFMKATGWSLRDGVWYKDGVAQEHIRPAGQASQECSKWYLGYPMYPQERDWAERWLPLPPQK